MPFELFRKGRIKPTWRYRAKRRIWRILPTDDGWMVGEDRDIAGKITTFFCLNRHTGKVFWEGREFGETWWIGMETVFDGILLLHGYAVPDMPWHKKIIAVGLSSGEKLWENVDLCFEFVDKSRIIASSGAEGMKTFVALDPDTGAIVEKLGPVDWESAKQEDTTIIFPRVFSDADANPPNSLLDHLASKSCAGSVEYITSGAFTVLGYCVQNAQGTPGLPFRQEVEVCRNADFSVAYFDVVYESTSGMIPDSFLVQDDMLYYIRENTVLTAVQLPKSEQPQ